MPKLPQFQAVDLSEAVERIIDPKKTQHLTDSVAYFSFPTELEIAPVFPFFGCLVRFYVRVRSNPSKCVSVYFDTVGTLGCATNYWEAFPIADDAKRYLADEWEQMQADIVKELLGGEDAKE